MTRKLSATIETLPKNGTVTYTLSGQAVGYSSSWYIDTQTEVGDGNYERVPNTNKALTSFNVNGNDPKISKSVNSHT